MSRIVRAAVCVLAIEATIAVSRAAAADVLCGHLTTPPGAVYLYGDEATAAVFASPFVGLQGDDYLSDGAPSGGPPIAGVATRSEAIAQAVRDALAPDHLDDVTGAGFSAEPPTPSVAVVSGPSEAMIDQFVAGLLQTPGLHEFSTSQIDNTNGSGFMYPSCGIGCCSVELSAPKVSHFTASTLAMNFVGPVVGCGIMIVDGDLTIASTFKFEGLLIVRGTITLQDDAAAGTTGNQTTYGTVWTKGLSLGGSGSVLARFSSDVLTDAAAPFGLPWCQQSICGDGIVSNPEECDDGNLADGDCCSSQCTVPAICDDGSVCTLNDRCDGGVCTGDPLDCGSCRACDAQVGCHPAPAESCRRSRAPRANRLEIRQGMEPVGNRLVWSWRRGEATSPAAFGDPSATDDYTLCVFGRRGRDLLMTAGAPAGGTCGGRPCWWPHGSLGIRYADPSAPDGLAALHLDGGADGLAKIRAVGKGANLELPPPPLSVPITVQLQAGNGTCWEATYESPNVFQDHRRLRARGR